MTTCQKKDKIDIIYMPIIYFVNIKFIKIQWDLKVLENNAKTFLESLYKNLLILLKKEKY